MDLTRREVIRLLTSSYLAANWLPLSQAAEQNDYKGIFVIAPSGKLRFGKILSLSFVDGICLRSRWNMISPVEGEYNLTYFIEGLKLAAKWNKKVTLWVTPGTGTPDWVYAKGAKYVQQIKRNSLKTIPIPWNKVYLDLWFEFITQLAYNLKDHPNLKTIVVSVAHFGSTEFHLPKILRNVKDFSYDTIFSLWRDAIDYFAQQFPQQFLCTHSTVGILGNNDLPDKIVLYGAKAYSGRFCTQMNNLSADIHPSLLKRMKRLSEHMPVGFQAVGYFGRKKRGGVLSKAIKLAYKIANVRYFELYRGDIVKARHQKVLGRFSKKLRKG